MRIVILLLVSYCFSIFGSLNAAEARPLSEAEKKQRQLRISQMINGLTDSRERMHDAAIDGLAAMGEPALPDLLVLTKNESPSLRLRVALVLTKMSTNKSAIPLIRLSEDKIDAVREVAALGLGRKKGDDVLRRLAVMLNDEVPAVRESAAIAMGFVDDGRGIRLLANSYVAEHIPENMLPDLERAVRRAKSAKHSSLKALVNRPHQMDYVIRYLNQLHGPALHSLLEITWEIGDPRLCVPLLSVFERDVDLTTMSMAAISLRANGDSRCLGVLCRIAAGKVGPRTEAARTLSALTGHQAGPGSAWDIWWRDHRAKVESMIKRDAFIADLHNPKRVPNQAELGQFAVKDLEVLVEGVLGTGAQQWPKLALRALQQDDPQRWTDYLLARHAVEGDEVRRVGLLLLIESLNDPAARAELAKRHAVINRSMRKAKETGALREAYNSERPVLGLFTEN